IEDGILKEFDFKNEMQAADELRKVTTKAKVVEGVEVQDNIYIMKKADGVCLADLAKYIGLTKEGIEKDIQLYQKYVDNSYSWAQDCLREAQDKLKLFEELNTKIGEITPQEAKTLLEKYQDVMVEQFSKIDERGKLIHGDIHSGNIYVDIEAMRQGKKDFFTLIDAGNTIQQSKENAVRLLNLTKYINNADVENITKYVLEGAKLPEGMTENEAYEKVLGELKKSFFDYKTHIDPVTTDSLFAITDGIMQKLNIIPASTQGSLVKTKQSAQSSMDKFFSSFIKSLETKAEERLEKQGVVMDEDEVSIRDRAKIMAEISKLGMQAGQEKANYFVKQKFQENANLALLSPQEKLKIKKSTSAPKANSEEYLAYVLKQFKKDLHSEIKEIISQKGLLYLSEPEEMLKAIKDEMALGKLKSLQGKSDEEIMQIILDSLSR
ncbi:hypothetical protein IJ670_08440, partial [bacterium]|nr:hypothetical protein [bacterium]